MEKRSISTSNYSSLEMYRGGAVCLKYRKTEDQLSDIFTKALPRRRFELLREKLGLDTWRSVERVSTVAC